MAKYNFVVYSHPDGEEVIKMYEDPKNVPNPEKPFEVLVFIETDDGRFDFGKIVRVKFGAAVVDDLRNKYFQELPWEDNDPEDIAELYIKTAWATSVSAQTVQAVEKEENTPEFKDLLIKAIQYEYDNQKFDDFSWFILILKGAEYIDLNMPDWAFQLGHWLRTKKYKEDRYWNGDLPGKEYTPAFLPNFIFYDTKEDRVNSLKDFFNRPYKSLKEEIDKKITREDPISKMLKEWLHENIDECQKITDGYLEKLADFYIPDGNFQTILKHYHAFLVGLYNGILEFLAGLCDLVAIIILILRDEIGFRMSDKLVEKFENFVNELFYNTFELLNKIFKKVFEIFKDFGIWLLTYKGKSYYLLKEFGELIPDILTFLIPILKGSKVAKISTLAGKEITEEVVEETIEKTVKEASEDVAKELTEEEAKHISKTAKEALESGETKEAIEEASKKAEKDVDGRVPEEVKVPPVKRLVNPQTGKEFGNFLRGKYLELTGSKTQIFGGNTILLEADKTTTVTGILEDVNTVARRGEVMEGITKMGMNDGGINILRSPKWGKILEKYKYLEAVDKNKYYKKVTDEFWEKVNKPWLDEAIKRKDPIRFVTDPDSDIGKYVKTGKNKFAVDESGNKIPTIFSREVEHLRKNGYQINGHVATKIK
ncbi:hypothetical protein HNP38_002127 [Chryseobacterium defluvii]|uniref:Uncharacterized protein n=1 Tax=Chryseobacterium defluvii TaxID=160396 RepID=A0A840KBP0_9FLAO|nr:hypothetical protein [Chryseobacterium defluvii]MBB4806831.1 hypothetical protein [Chryseobacterium defluvii]